ncbi:TPA: ribosome recycling factor [bacterium]|nr:MAG: ribosome recycling factor [Candidatus Hydrogenedentes bacterium CG1_02_42_14]PIU48084.1 MAG: ribosome recycling factor [Candidatus Hydrogenedentes bacterium CG07_land_8_20_14_0_80_42_17]HBW47846.1 ribosome recycling factor [bacterium]
MITEVMSDAKNRMNGAIEAFKKELLSIRTGRASASMLDDIMVEMYGSNLPINQLATVSTPDPRLIVIQPWDKSSLSAIEKAVQAANIGITPSNDGKVIRLPIPSLTEERRKQLAKDAHKRAEESRISVRNVRRDAKTLIEDLEKESEISKDDAHRATEELQKLTDSFISKIDGLTAAKEKEIMEF